MFGFVMTVAPLLSRYNFMFYIIHIVKDIFIQSSIKIRIN